jgi:DNA-directed RNA polymerase I and III subunit RPAC1
LNSGCRVLPSQKLHDVRASVSSKYFETSISWPTTVQLPHLHCCLSVAMTQPSAAEIARRKFVEFTAETIKNTSNSDYPGVWPGEDNGWSKSRFAQQLKIEFHESEPYDLCFSLIGVDAAIANAFRRILIAEIPTLAIEHVFIKNNTSVIQDEVLSHRLGLIPFTGKHEGMDFLHWYIKGDPRAEIKESTATDYTVIKLSLDVTCTWHEEGKERFKRGERDARRLYNNSSGLFTSQVRE